MTQQLDKNTRMKQRLQTLMKRQSVTKWGPDYEPAIQAVPGEAPRHSHAFAMPSARLERRVHVLSKSERSMCVLALYNDKLWEFHEQHVLPMGAAPHPLTAHPVWQSYPWPSSSGTIELSSRLGLLGFHPTFLVQTSAGCARAPYPWIGDFLLYLTDEQGPYLVAWDCKGAPDAHAKPGPGPLRIRGSRRAQEKAEARETTYRACMEELGIRVQRVSDVGVNESVRCNLRRLFSLHMRQINLPETLTSELKDAFREALQSGEPPVATIDRLVKTGSTDRLQARCLLDQMIWQRELRVDLFHPVLADRPLKPEVRDVLSVYSDLFAR